jgi:hypothetical protein
MTLATPAKQVNVARILALKRMEGWPSKQLVVATLCSFSIAATSTHH